MGLAGKMKRKFSLSTLQSKSNVQPDEAVFDYDIESPPYSPTASEMERPIHHPQILLDLRVACASLVNQTNPPDPDDEPDHQEILRQVEAGRKAKYVAQARAAEAKSQKGEVRELKSKPRKEESKKDQPKRYSSTRPRDDVQPQELKPIEPMPAQAQAQIKQASRPLTSGFNSYSQQQQRRHSDKIKPSDGGVLEPVHTEAKPPQDQRRPTDEAAALHEIRQSIHSRPKTSAAACVDYEGPTTAEDSSKSTSRSTSNYDALHRPTSTGLTSLAQTPGDEKRRSHMRRPSDQSYQEELEREKAVWFKEQQAKQQAEQYANSGRAARPASRTSKLSRMTSRSESVDRPPSRASSLASSIADGISHYIRPRASVDGDRSGRSGRSSAMSNSRSNSRSSSMSRRSSSGFWRRGSLRRKSSWASFRSGRFDNDERNTKRNGEPNLNRPLPALPGLDQYKETKTHIGQLMKAGGRKKKVSKKSISDPQPVMSPDTEYTATLPKPATPILDRAMRQEQEERAYQAQLREQYHQYHTQEHKHHSHHHHHHHHDHGRRSTVPKNMESAHRPNKDKSEKRASRAQHPPRRSTAPVLAYGDASDIRLSALTKSPTNPLSPSQTSKSPNLNLLHNAPPIIRGPSYKRELEDGVYPRPMDVASGTSPTQRASPGYPSGHPLHNDIDINLNPGERRQRGSTSGAAMGIVEVYRPSGYEGLYVDEMYKSGHHGHRSGREKDRQRERGRDEERSAAGRNGSGSASAGANGLMGKMGRMFGSGGSGGERGGERTAARRAVAAN